MVNACTPDGFKHDVSLMKALNEPEASNGPEATSLQFGFLFKASELDNRRARKSEAAVNSGANADATADIESAINNNDDAFPMCKVQRIDVPWPSTASTAVESRTRSKPGRRAS